MAIRNRVYILTGTFREYTRLRIPGTTYLGSINQFRGIRGGILVKAGTWYNRPDIPDIMEEAIISGLSIMTYEDYMMVTPPQNIMPNAELRFPQPTETVVERIIPDNIDNDTDKYFFRIGYDNR